MKSSEISPNTVLFSEKYGKYGQVIAKKGFMCLTLFIGGECVWLPSADLYRICPKYEKKYLKNKT